MKYLSKYSYEYIHTLFQSLFKEIKVVCLCSYVYL